MPMSDVALDPPRRPSVARKLLLPRERVASKRSYSSSCIAVSSPDTPSQLLSRLGKRLCISGLEALPSRTCREGSWDEEDIRSVLSSRSSCPDTSPTSSSLNSLDVSPLGGLPSISSSLSTLSRLASTVASCLISSESTGASIALLNSVLRVLFQADELIAHSFSAISTSVAELLPPLPQVELGPGQLHNTLNSTISSLVLRLQLFNTMPSTSLSASNPSAQKDLNEAHSCLSHALFLLKSNPFL
eukprot:tig00020614_g12232.t1